MTATLKTYDIAIYTKYVKNTFGILVHNYFAIPQLHLEIHPGRFYYGTHHDYGKFKKRSECVKVMKFCELCVDYLLEKSTDLDDIWWYPILNCETLTRGLTQHIPISFQTILITCIFTTFIIGIQKVHLLLVVILFIIMLLIYNNTHYKMLKNKCIHLQSQ